MEGIRVVKARRIRPEDTEGSDAAKTEEARESGIRTARETGGGPVIALSGD